MDLAVRTVFSGPSLDHAVLDYTLNDPRGDVGVFVNTKGRPILLAAKRQVGVDSARLRDSIYMVHRRVGRYQEIDIGSDNKIALLHHEGTREHVIRAKNVQFLKFTSKGRVVYARDVMHPGTKANRYLSDNLYLAYV